MRTLILFNSLEGQTAKIAQYLATTLRYEGHLVSCQEIPRHPPTLELEEFDAIIIGACIHSGKYRPELLKLIRDHEKQLAQMPSAFYFVLTDVAAEEGEVSLQEARSYTETMEKETGWQPDLTTSFAGALRYTTYNLPKRWMISMVSRLAGGDKQTSHNHEYTNWRDVAKFAALFGEHAGRWDNAREMPKPEGKRYTAPTASTQSYQQRTESFG